jgi:hypothetical protein
MMRLKNTETGVQVVITDAKADRLIAEGTYEAVPDAEQPPKENTQEPTKKAGRTDIAAAIADLARPF